MGELVDSSGAASLLNPESGALNQFSISNRNLVIIGALDSTMEQTQANGAWPARYTEFKNTGKSLEFAKGLINFGGSGLQMTDFVNGALDGGFTGPDIENDTDLGVGNWDTYGHKPVGAVSLATALAWRNAIDQSYPVVWVITGGFNDVLLNARGNDTEAELTTYFAGLLDQIINAISANNTNDLVILRQPNQLVARPYVNDLPVSAVYPSFGVTLQDDIDLLDKWNNALELAYRGTIGRYKRAVYMDTLDTVFGDRDASYVADGSDLPSMGTNDNVHPQAGSSQLGYSAVFLELMRFMFGEKQSPNRRISEAEAWADGLPWVHWDEYLSSQPEAYDKLFNSSLAGNIGAGLNFIDINIPKADFDAAVDHRDAIYLSLIGQAGVRLTSWSSIDLSPGVSLRLISFGTLPDEFLNGINGQEIRVFVDKQVPAVQEPLKTQVFDGRVVGPGSNFSEVLPAGWSAVHSDPITAGKQGWVITHNLGLPINNQHILAQLVRDQPITGSFRTDIQNINTNSFTLTIDQNGATNLDMCFTFKVFS